MEFEQARTRIFENQHPIGDMSTSLREHMLGDEGGIRARYAAGIAAVGLAVGVGIYGYLSGWGQHIDVQSTVQVEANHIWLPGNIDIITMGVSSRVTLDANFYATSPSLFGKSIDIPEGSVYSCANRAGNINLKMMPLTDSTNNKVTLNPDNTDKNYRFAVINDGGGKEHLRLFVDPYKGFKVERAEMSTVPDDTCSTGASGLISTTRSLDPTTAANLQSNMNATADRLPELECPAQMANSGIVSIAIEKWARAELQVATGLVRDELTAEHPHVPDDVQQVVDKLSNLANGEIEVWYTPNPNAKNADLSVNLGLEAASFTHEPQITDQQIAQSEGVNTNEITTYHVDRGSNCGLNSVAAGDAADVIATAKKQQDAYDAKYHGALVGGNS